MCENSQRGTESLMSFPVDNISHVLSQLAPGGVKPILCDPLGEDS